MKQLASTLLCIIAMTLSGCFSIHNVTYFEPTPASEMQVQRGSRGPKEIAVYNLGDEHKLSVIMFHELNGNDTIRCLFGLSENKTLIFSNHIIQIENLNDGSKLPASIDKIQANIITDGIGEFKYFSATDTLKGGSHQYRRTFGRTGIGSRPFQIDVVLSNALPQQFSLTLPPVNYCGKVVVFPTTMFNKNSGVFYAPQPW